MVKRQVPGSIICTESMSSTLGGSGSHSCTAFKHALLGLVKSTASELGKHGIGVIAFLLSEFPSQWSLLCTLIWMRTQIEVIASSLVNLKGIVLKAKHVAEAALFLVLDESVYVSGHNLTLTGVFV